MGLSILSATSAAILCWAQQNECHFLKPLTQCMTVERDFDRRNRTAPRKAIEIRTIRNIDQLNETTNFRITIS
jgi:hypothetical protein